MRVFIYIMLVPFSLVGASFAWDAFAVGKLFYCSDSCGPIDFIPPFVHNVVGDHYIVPALIVWILWAALLAVALLLPAFLAGIPFRSHPPSVPKEQTR
jgi:hypothetical protein